jgi:hypothetical protein
MEPAVKVQEMYDDNVRLRTMNEQDSWITTLSPEVTLGSRTETSDINVYGRWDSKRYHSISALNTDNQFINFNGSHFNERNTWQVDLTYNRDTSIESELEDTGRITDSAIRREEAIIAPSWTHALNERTTVQLSGNYRDVQYEDPGNTGLNDYKTHTISGYVQHQWTEPTAFFASVYASGYKQETDTSSTRIDYQGLNLGVIHNLTENLTLTASAGRQKNDTHQEVLFFGFIPVTTDTSATGNTYRLELEKQDEITTYTASFERTVSPSARGNLNNRDDYSFTVRHRYSRRLNLDFTARYLEQESTLGTNVANDRTYWSVRPGVRYRFNENTTLTGAYQHRYQKYANASDDADSDQVMFTLNYNWDKFSLSR